MNVVLACVLAGPIATSGSDRRVLVAPLEVQGELAAPLRAELDQRVREGLDADTFEVVTQGPARTVRTAVVARDRDLDITMTLVDRDGAKVLARVEEHCDMCSTVEAGDTIASLGMALSRRVELTAVEQPSAPPPPRPIVDLAPPPPAPPRRPVRWAIGWTALAAGLATGTAGAALLALDGRPIHRKCSGSNVDGDGTCRFMHATLVPGAVVTTLGVGLLATGIALVVIESKRGAKRSALRALLEHTPAWQRARALARR